MLRGSSSLASVFFCSVCLLVALSQRATTPRKKGCIRDITHQVSTLMNCSSMQKLEDLKLYTPNRTSYEQCPRATFTCFRDELSVISNELVIYGLDNNRTKSILKRMSFLLLQHNKPESGCLQCELFEQKDVRKFLGALLNILQMVNSEKCKRENIQVAQRTTFSEGDF
ncbi:interleukin 15, like [Cyprinodon tularosa]|uniref:interleukin 15, like n=1 Tax=Cyprinodon tularosa TaxID=77115 RepID=UPI0018E2605D|nr:interleukin 15, like [Cyprinodon tularosa]